MEDPWAASSALRLRQPRPGRQKVAHGVSRGLARPTFPPSPLPPRRERGAEGGVRVLPPRAHALGYVLPPLAGLTNRPHGLRWVLIPVGAVREPPLRHRRSLVWVRARHGVPLRRKPQTAQPPPCPLLIPGGDW